MEQLKHECGVAMIRLLKPLDYYKKKYGTYRYGLNKLYLLMEKQHNRGQEGAGVACVNMDVSAGKEYMFRERAVGANAITEIFKRIDGNFIGQLYMGHLRYSTTGKSGLQYVHPFLRRNNWRAKNLSLCGNFNLTNIDEVFKFLTSKGQSPRVYSDSYIMLEFLGHRLDREVERLYQEALIKGLENLDITNYIENNICIANVLKTSMPYFDGGYVMCGLTGSGEMFTVRDPWGIRPAFYYKDDEIFVVASERPVIQTAFDLNVEDIHEVLPGQALIVKKNGECSFEQILEPKQNSACSFERIYFSRSSDIDIYKERKRLGEQLVPAVKESIGDDIENSVFSYIPNTAEVSFYGLISGFRKLGFDVRTEKVVWKDIKLRTFITEGTERKDLAAHVYDVTYGSVCPNKDNLVIIDDSIVRGTTLKESIFKILDRLHPKKIVMVSSAPQIRYPDYYGIDMSKVEELCAFRAAIALIKERKMDGLITDTYQLCKNALENNGQVSENFVRRIYEPFSAQEISVKIAQMLSPEDMTTPIEIVFQSIDGLHKACPSHPGDWYFTGHYPTFGGNRMVNRAFMNFVEKFF